MSTILITTPQNIELEYELASVGDRIVAALIDLAILFGYTILISLGFSYGLGGNALPPGSLQVILFIAFLPACFYTLLSELLMNGQTVGKRVMKIKVISLNGNRPSFSQYLMRWLFRLIDLWITSYILGIVMIAATEKHQRFGDLVANATLIKTIARMQMQQTLYTPVADTNYKLTYPEVGHLKDADMQLVKEVLANVRKSGNTMLALNAMRKIETVLHIKSQHEPVTFLYAVLSDYNHITANA